MAITPTLALNKILANSGQAPDYYSYATAGKRVDPAWNDDAKVRAIEGGQFGPEIAQYWNMAKSGGLDGVSGLSENGIGDSPGMTINSQPGRWLSEVLAHTNAQDALSFIGGANADPNAQRAGDTGGGIHQFAERAVEPMVLPAILAAGGYGLGTAFGGAGTAASEAAAYNSAMENVALANAGAGGGSTVGGALTPGAATIAGGGAGTAFDTAMENIMLSEGSRGTLATSGGSLLNPSTAQLLNIGGSILNPNNAATSAQALGLPQSTQTFPSTSGPASAQPASGTTPAGLQGAGSAPAVPGGGGGTPPILQSGSTSAATQAAATGAGTSFVDSLIKQMKDNAIGIGLIGAGTLMSAGQKSALPNEQQIQSLGAEAQGVAKQLISQYQSQTLSPGQQASLDQLANNTKNQLRQYFASIGQSDSTAAVQALAQVDQSLLGMKQEMLDSALSQGLSAIGIAQGPYNTIAQYQLGQDAQLKQAFGNFASAAGTLFGRQAGTPQSPTTSVTAAPTITSAR